MFLRSHPLSRMARLAHRRGDGAGPAHRHRADPSLQTRADPVGRKMLTLAAVALAQEAVTRRPGAVARRPAAAPPRARAMVRHPAAGTLSPRAMPGRPAAT